MVSVENINQKDFLIILSPNNSLTNFQRIIFLSSISFLCIFIAIIFFILGATLILPFAGLEVFFVLLAFYLNFKWSSKREKIFLSQEKVKIEKGRKHIEFSWEEFRTFAYFNVNKKDMDSLKLSFTSKGKEIEIGSFLNEEDKKSLKNNISDIINTLNSHN